MLLVCDLCTWPACCDCTVCRHHYNLEFTYLTWDSRVVNTDCSMRPSAEDVCFVKLSHLSGLVAKLICHAAKLICHAGVWL